jgi:hypothetical protein
MKYTSKYQTVATICYKPIITMYPNPRAHGNVCLLQIKRGAKGRLVGRQLNVNGSAEESSIPRYLSPDEVLAWEQIGTPQYQQVCNMLDSACPI